MKKKFNVVHVLIVVLLAVVATMMVSNQRVSTILKTQRAEIERATQTIKEQQNKIEDLECQINQCMNLIPFDAEKARITGIQNKSDLRKDDEFSERHFNGTISLSWDDIPNAFGYQIEFNYDPMLEDTTDAYYYRFGAFYSYKVDISEGLKFRIRAYSLQDGEKVYGEFSDWISLEVE